MSRLSPFAVVLRFLMPLLALAVFASPVFASPVMADAHPTAPGTAFERVADIDWLVDKIAQRYAYREEAQIDLEKVRALYKQEAAAATTRSAWLHVLEDLIATLHDHHVQLNTNVASSPQLIPSGTDIWAEIEDGRAVITQVLPDSPAEHAGLRAGDVVTAIDDKPAMVEIANALPTTTTIANAGGYTLRALLAGDHESVRTISLADRRRIVLPPYERPEPKQPVTWRWLSHSIGYIRIENSLGSEETVEAFDRAAEGLRSAKGIILDLRFTPSGGNTGVAIPILGRFVAKAEPYQRYEGEQFPGGVMLDEVEPRGPFTLTAPLVVLVGRWTGSMAEGMAIGLDALGRGTVVGTQMAGLRGGIEQFTLPNTGIDVSFPVFRILHVNGTPREDFVPAIQVDQKSARGTDPGLAAAFDEFRHLGVRLTPKECHTSR